MIVLNNEMLDCLNGILEDLVQDEKLLPVSYKGKLYYPFTIWDGEGMHKERGIQLDHKENGYLYCDFDDPEFTRICLNILLYAFDKAIAIDIPKI